MTDQSAEPTHKPTALFGPYGTRDAVTKDAYAYLVLACVITWSLDIPIALTLYRGEQPGPVGGLLAALSAFGPTIAAVLVASRRGQRAGVFGPWRAQPQWLLLALFTLPALHFVATTIEWLLGGHPAHWFYPPTRPEHFAALIFFSIGEEFGWRGFAYKRLAQVHGPVLANVPLGVAWTLWHLMMWVTPSGLPSITILALAMLELIFGSVVFAAIFERSNRSIAVAIALHMSAHLDNTSRAPETELRLKVLRLVVLGLCALWAARWLRQKANVAQS